MSRILTVVIATTITSLVMISLLAISSPVIPDTTEQDKQVEQNRVWCNSKGGVYIDKQCFKVEIISFFGD